MPIDRKTQKLHEQAIKEGGSVIFHGEGGTEFTQMFELEDLPGYKAPERKSRAKVVQTVAPEPAEDESPPDEKTDDKPGDEGNKLPWGDKPKE